MQLTRLLQYLTLSPFWNLSKFPDQKKTRKADQRSTDDLYKKTRLPIIPTPHSFYSQQDPLGANHLLWVELCSPKIRSSPNPCGVDLFEKRVLADTVKLRQGRVGLMWAIIQ